MKHGVYILCNDRLLSMAIAFLNAFRAHNPGLPLCLIPYRDDDIEHLSALSGTYDFSIFSDREVLDQCDRIGARISPSDKRFRKLAAWQGAFDQFIYIDIDNLVLEDITPLFSLLETYRFVLCDSHVEGNEQWSWKESVFSSGKLSAEQIRFAANTSFIISEKNAISLADVTQREREIGEIVPHMQLHCGEQPLLNYLIVTSGLPASSITELVQEGRGPETGLAYWAGSAPEAEARAKILPGGRLELDDPALRVAFIHWSGLWQAGKVQSRVHRALQLTGLRRKDRAAVRWWFPYKRLWLYYRYLRR